MPQATYGYSKQMKEFDVETAKKYCARKKSTNDDVREANVATGMNLHDLNDYKKPDCDNVINKGFMKQERHGWGFVKEPSPQDFYLNMRGGKKLRRKTYKKSHRKSSKKQRKSRRGGKSRRGRR